MHTIAYLNIMKIIQKKLMQNRIFINECIGFIKNKKR